MKKCYTTEYIQDGDRYGGYLWAEDDDHAAEMVRLRGLEERIEGEYDLYQAPTWRKLRLKRKEKSTEERLHYLTYLAFVALQSTVYSVGEVMGDKGWFHMYIHRLHLTGDNVNVPQAVLDESIYTVEKRLGFTP